MIQYLKRYLSVLGKIIGSAALVMSIAFNLQISAKATQCASCPYQYFITIFPTTYCSSGYGYSCYTGGTECQMAVTGCG